MLAISLFTLLTISGGEPKIEYQNSQPIRIVQKVDEDALIIDGLQGLYEMVNTGINSPQELDKLLNQALQKIKDPQQKEMALELLGMIAGNDLTSAASLDKIANFLITQKKAEYELLKELLENDNLKEETANKLLNSLKNKPEAKNFLKLYQESGK